MSKLLIIESPGKKKKLAEILGPGWTIEASYGHIRDLPDNEMGVEPPEFVPVYVPSERGRATIDKLNQLAKAADEIYLGTDPDREGEAISWHLKEALNLKSPKRVTFGEITANAVKAAIEAPRTINVDLVQAQEGRRVLDRFVGYTVSPEISRATNQKLSAGRVQSVAVRLVVDRDREIKAFKPTTHYGALLRFQGGSGEWTAEWVTKPDFVTDDNPYFMDKEFAQAVANVRLLVVKSFDEREQKRSPPPPFITSTLQQAASVSLNMNPKATMDAAQKLYEAGHITYHRSDNPNISDDSLEDIYAVATKLNLEIADKPRRFPVPSGAQEGHVAITPTHWEVEETGDTASEKALYKLIRLRAIASQLADARYAVRTARLTAGHAVNDRDVEFEAKGRTLIFYGWLQLVEGDQTEEKDDKTEPSNPIPDLMRGARVDAESGELLEKKTKAPSRYTQASLIKKLEAEGIGRPSTYASIMENIVSKGYIDAKEKFLKSTATGELVVDSMVKKFAFMELGFTRDVEEQLDRIANGAALYKAVVSDIYQQLQGEVATFKQTVVPKFPCPKCGKALRRIKKKESDEYFWGCSGFSEGCKHACEDHNGKPVERKPPAVSAHKCGVCGKGLIRRPGKKPNTFWWGCSGYPECKQTYFDDKGKPDFNTKPKGGSND